MIADGIDLFPSFSDRRSLRNQNPSYKDYVSKIEAYQTPGSIQNPFCSRAEAIVSVANEILRKDPELSLKKIIPRLVAHLYKLPVFEETRDLLIAALRLKILAQENKKKARKVGDPLVEEACRTVPPELDNLGTKLIHVPGSDSEETQRESLDSDGSPIFPAGSPNSRDPHPLQESREFREASPPSPFSSDGSGDAFQEISEKEPAFFHTRNHIQGSSVRRFGLSYMMSSGVGGSLGVLMHLSSHYRAFSALSERQNLQAIPVSDACVEQLQHQTQPTGETEKQHSPREIAVVEECQNPPSVIALEKEDLSVSCLYLSQCQNQPTIELLKFFEGIEFGKKFSLPDAAVCKREGNALTIRLPEPVLLSVDVKKPLDLKEFNELHTPYGKTHQVGEKKVEDLTCFGTIGPLVWARIKKGVCFEARMVIQRDSNTFTFTEGGPSSVSSIQFNTDRTVTITAKIGIGWIAKTMSEQYLETDLFKLMTFLERP